MYIILIIAVLLIGLLCGFIIANFFRRKSVDIFTRKLNESLQAESQLKQKTVLLEESFCTINQKLCKADNDILALTRKLSGLEALQPQLEENIGVLRSERDRFQKLSESHQILISDLNARVSGLNVEKKVLEQQFNAQQQFMEELRKQAKVEFENLANQILKTKAKDLSEQSEKNLEIILKPLQEKLKGFEKTVTETYTAEARERFALKSEVERLIGATDSTNQGAKALTQALLGNSKMQGDWGEMVLERILEESGLSEGREYHAQKEHESDEGDRLRPDFRINLPEDKHIIIDSKVSLTAYELYCRSESNEEKKTALAAHLKSIQKHIDELGSKHYAKLKGIRSPDFVFAFIPIEPAYILAMQTEPQLSIKAWRKGVAVVTATTLLTSLRTVASIWRLENQNRNALKIAEEAGKLYDKFCGFLEDFQKIGNTLEMGQSHYLNAMGKLKEGSGNVFRKMEMIRKLGAAPKNRIKQELLDSADNDEIDEISVLSNDESVKFISDNLVV